MYSFSLCRKMNIKSYLESNVNNKRSDVFFILEQFLVHFNFLVQLPVHCKSPDLWWLTNDEVGSLLFPRIYKGLLKLQELTEALYISIQGVFLQNGRRNLPIDWRNFRYLIVSNILSGFYVQHRVTCYIFYFLINESILHLHKNK